MLNTASIRIETFKNNNEGNNSMYFWKLFWKKCINHIFTHISDHASMPPKNSLTVIFIFTAMHMKLLHKLKLSKHKKYNMGIF